jgi:alanyl-tRNA synthetase
MTGHEIRQKFLDYFAERGHRVVRSSPLLPANDPTLLFTNAGMNQFKDVFLGAEKRDFSRAVSSQKCVRAGGKHNDLDEVGRTARHHTFFEMLGNFSFGDYFKKEAIYFAWDLLVNEYRLDPNRLWFSVFEGDAEVPADEEAIRYWEQVGARPERILRFGRKDNFWQMGDTGPCGPCSEIHYYLGDNPEDPAFNRRDYVNGPGDITMEIWNLVFMQFNRIGEGNIIGEGERRGQYESYRLEALPAPSVDTGAGLERLTAVLQGVKSNYDTDLIQPIIDFVSSLAGVAYVYDSAEGMSMRVIADHARATAFSIADGISPGNVGRNYVLRKIMRRAIYHGVKGLGLKSPFFHKVTDLVVESMARPYPELLVARPAIEQTVRGEEQRFNHILSVGEPRLVELLETYQPGVPPMLELARTYDTYGVPRDLIRVVLGQHGKEIPEDEYNKEFDAALRELQQQTAPSLAATAASRRSRPIYEVETRALPRTEFTGYAESETTGAIVKLIIVGDETRNSLGEGETGEILLDRTPFYAEAGGQIGDTGVLVSENALTTIEDTYAPVSGYHFHKARVESGELKAGDLVSARVDSERRRRIRANHTGTHLLHAALREVLGPHVKQAGSLVAPDRLRFDFTHYAPLADDEIAEIERLVNTEVLNNRAVETEIQPLEEALKSGAMALFGEKYASDVRVVSVPGFSTELCGGTHVRATGDIGPFKIVGDSSIAAGVRRLEAKTADGTIALLQEDELVLKQLSERLRAKPHDIPAQVERLVDQVRRYEREIEQLKLKIALSTTDAATLTEAASVFKSDHIKGILVGTQRVEGFDPAGMRAMADALLQKHKAGVVVLGQASDGKASLLVRVSDDLTKRLNAVEIVREIAAIVGGKGGGRADMATGGGSQPEKLDEALGASWDTVHRLLTSSKG